MISTLDHTKGEIPPIRSALSPRDNTWEKYNRLKTKLTELGFNFEK